MDNSIILINFIVIKIKNKKSLIYISLININGNLYLLNIVGGKQLFLSCFFWLDENIILIIQLII